ncbi:hypothetical protein [Nostoc sp. C117]|uniref:hypothetical protein n=1 Tax=Nostoc sp. C117 TaxID=3349875 RepID=UPI00370D74EE
MESAIASCSAIWQFTSRGDRQYKIPSNAYRFVKIYFARWQEQCKGDRSYPKKGANAPNN